MRSMVQAIYSNIQGNSWVCLGCSLWSWYGQGGDTPLSDILHDSYNTNETVGQYIHTWIIVFILLHQWWGAWFKLFILKTRVTAEHGLGVVSGHGMV